MTTIRALPVLLFVLVLAAPATACDDGSQRPVLPQATITPTPVTPVAGEGPFLQPLTTGQEVAAPDARYTVRLPGNWHAIQAPPAELAYAQPGSTKAADAVTVNITRQNVGEGLTVRAYADSAQQANSRVYKDIVTLAYGPVQVGTHPGFRWVYTATTSGSPHLIYQLFIIDGRQAFVLTGVAPHSANVTDTQALFDSIAGSWTFVRG